ncbi:MAG: response regulator [Pirellulaceae bacterium]|jgi:CheY-like chemotaxis protein|nr:response regulator [Pirellulaceae bacterium]
MVKQVLDIGNCAADHAAIRYLIERGFDARVTRAYGEPDALAVLRSQQIDLVLVNRLLDRGGDGLQVLLRIKSEPDLASVPVMLVTDYPQYQRAAIEAGAEHGFGKSELQAPETRDKLKRFLGTDAVHEGRG